MARGGRRRFSLGGPAAYGTGFFLLSVALVASLWIVPYLPTNDGPESVLAVHIENHFADPGTIYSQVFRPAPQFAGRGFTILFEPLEELFGWRRGLQVALSVIVLSCAWGFVAIVAAVDPRRLPLAFFGFPLALSWPLYMGFFAFVVSSGVGLFVIAASLRPMGAARRIGVAALLLLQAILHMFPAILTGLVVAVAQVAKAPRGERLREFGLAALLGLPAAGVAVTAFVAARHAAVSVDGSESFHFVSLSATLATWPRTLAPGPLVRALCITMAITLAAGVGLVRAARGTTTPIDRSFSVVGVVFLVTAFFAPRDVPGWQCFSERFVLLGIVLVTATVPLERFGSRTWLVAITSWGAAAVVLGLAFPFHRRLAAASNDAILGLSARVERHGVWLPVTLEPSGAPLTRVGDAEVPLLAPLRHIGALYAIAEGGLPPYTFASNSATWPFAMRDDAIHPPPVPPARYASLLSAPEFQTNLAFRREQELELASYGMFYEGVLLTGATVEDLALWHSRGYVSDWERGSVMVGHFEPCSLDLVLRDGPSGDGELPRVDFQVGKMVILRDLQGQRTGGASEGEVHLVVDQAPCGRIGVRPHWDSSTRPQRSLCGNAGPSGVVSALLTRTDHEVLCSGRRPEASRLGSDGEADP